MPRMTVDGIGLEYELLGDAGAPAVALTPGGRFHMETPGIRELGQAIADSGHRVLIYDRPCCGKSDAYLGGSGESENQASALIGLIRGLDLGKTAIIGGSGGSRVSLLAASRDPEICSHLVIWWISGEPIGLMQLAGYYCGEAATLASVGGMEAVLTATSWAENIAMSPTTREYLLKQDPKRFIATLQQWATAYVPSDISPVPGMLPVHFAKLRMPTLVFNSHESDLSHTRTTSEWVSRLIPQSELRDPPWRDDEWNYQSVSTASGKGHSLFTSWPKLAPAIVDFIKQN